MSPTLPPELWIEIFSFAVHVPGLLKTGWGCSPEELMWEGSWAKTWMGDESFKTRRAIVLVSRDWLSMGRRFVYEMLVLGARTSVDALATLFEESMFVDGRRNGNSSPREDLLYGYGQWVRRVDITFSAFQPNHLLGLERLFQACHNVRIIFIHGSDYHILLFRLVSRLIECQILPSLRRISVGALKNHRDAVYHFCNGPYKVLELEWTLLPSANPLIAPLHQSIEFPLPTPLSFISALEVTFHEELAFLPALALPSLRYLSVGGLTDSSILSTLPFAERNGPKLIGLSLSTKKICSSLYELLIPMTALKSLVFDEIDLEEFQPPDSSTFPSITHIGLGGMRYSQCSDISSVQHGLSYISSHSIFPGLHTIRVLKHETPEILRREWEEPIKTAAECGIRLEDCEGQLLRCIPVPQAPSGDET